MARPPLHLAFLHLFGLAGLAFAQPLFDLLGKNPAFFAAHGSTRWEIIGFALVLVLAPPLVAFVIELLAGLIRPEAGAIAHLVFIALLAAVVALQIVRRADGLATAAIFALALAAGTALALLYARVEGVRSFASLLGIAPVLFLALFLFGSPTSKIVTGAGAKAFSVSGTSKPPIVLIVFDAFPSLSFQTPDGKVDATRFPNLAALSRNGRWYPNASNVHENTVFSVPSILDGRLPRKGQQPIVQDHPNNLFTLLGRTYTMNVAEEATNLCPPGLCSDTNAKSFGARMRQLADDVSVVYEYLALPNAYRKDLPQITDTWAGFRGRGAETTAKTEKRGAKFVINRLRTGRVARWRKAVGRIAAPGPRPQLNFIHAFFPHEPRQYLPDGREYQAGSAPDSSLEGPPSYNNAFLTQQSWQRELLQAEFTDRLIGEMIKRLKSVGAYDDALVVITADHGESFDVSPKPAPPFTPGRLGFRRAIRQGNAADIASIPLFVKYPKGRGPTGTDNRYVRTIDILPTVADTLGIRLPFKVDGRSLLDRSYRGQSNIEVERTFGPPLRMSTADWAAERKASLQRRIAIFGYGDKGAGIYRAGSRDDLLGSRPPAGSGRRVSGATILEPQRFADVDPAAAFSPSYVAGRLPRSIQPGTDLALAVNGEIVATGKSFAALGPNKLNWALLFPPSKLRRGRDRVTLYSAGGGALTPLVSAP